MDRLEDTLSVGIIGCGGIAQVHAEAWTRPPVARVRAVCDIVKPRAEALADRVKTASGERPTVYEEYALLLKETNVDVVSICLPHYLHAPVAVAAAESGRHVLCEKPMATSLRDADIMIAAARRNNVRLGISFQLRFGDDMRRVKKALDENALGQLILADTWVKWYRDDREYFRKDAVAESWRGKWATEGGALLINQAIHSVDLLQWFMGPVQAAAGFISTLTHRIEAEDTAVASLRFRSG
ncbi:MAG: Gfo/Idh/MocA family oxidoreductase, partial [Candidatus Bathyarchaeia archaeon]